MDVAATSTTRNATLNVRTATEDLPSAQVVDGNTRLNWKKTDLLKLGESINVNKKVFKPIIN